MGGAFSSPENNDNLINVLKIHGYITTKDVERAFRAVDRADYIVSSQREQAYKDVSCQDGNIHLSAPCVYSKVMEGLSLQPGLSFLNIGSGTGYLSTVAGLILGESGTNHGIEMHEDCLTYAYQHLEEFKKKSLDVDIFEFCEPVFQLGNFLNVMPNRQYDRVYCGAACPQAHEKFVKQFVKVGGILVMPYKDHLLRVKRTSETQWYNDSILPVSFATLMSPQYGTDRCLLQLPLWKPRTLQELCRSAIRSRLRKIVWSENTDLEIKRTIKIGPEEHSSSISLQLPPEFDNGEYPPISANRADEIRIDTEEYLRIPLLRILMACDIGDGEGHTDTNSDSEDGLFESRINQLLNHVNGRSDLTEDASNKDSDDSEFDENELGFVLVRKAHSMINSKACNSHSSSRSDDSSSDDNAATSRNGATSAIPIVTHSETMDIEETANNDALMNDNDPHESEFACQLNSHVERRSEEIGTKKRVLHSKINDKNERSNDENRSDSSSDDEPYEMTNNRRDYRAGQKRRSAKKIVLSESGGTSNCKKVWYKAETRSSNGTENSSRNISDNSSFKEPTNKSESSPSTSTENSNYSTIPGSDSDAYVSDTPPKKAQKKVYAYTIRTDRFSRFMKGKINRLPLPHPLRLYINYNREL